MSNTGNATTRTATALEVALTAPTSWECGRQTRPELVETIKRTTAPSYGRNASGRGGKVPTSVMIRYAGRWRRVYVMAYGNGGSPYVVIGGEVAHLDTDTEHRAEVAS